MEDFAALYGKRHVCTPRKEYILEARGTVGTEVLVSHDPRAQEMGS